MDELELKGVIIIVICEKLDNLVFVINCNLQCLDGLVIGNGKIINELEGIFGGVGWNVIKVIWGGCWDELLCKDISGKLIQLMNEIVDGDYQIFKFKDGVYVCEYFFGKYLEIVVLVVDWIDEQIWVLNCGGYDLKKVYVVLKKVQEIKGQLIVILVYIIKGYGMGDIVEGKNIVYQVKKMNMDGVCYVCDCFNVLVVDVDFEKLLYVIFLEGFEEYIYLYVQCQKLNGYLLICQLKFIEKFELLILVDFSVLLEE